MFFFKKIFLFLFIAWSLYFGGAGIQSSSTMMQGMGVVTLIAALICFYFLVKLIWRTMSFLFTFLILGGIVVFGLYCLGIIGGNGISFSDVSENAKKQSEIVSGDPLLFEDTEDIESDDASEPEMFGLTDAEMEVKEIAENTPSVPDLEPIAQMPENSVAPNPRNVQEASSGGLVGKLKTVLFGNQPQNTAPRQFNFNPMDFPEIHGKARVVLGSILRVNGLYVKMLGIDAPDIDQTCADKYGRSYACGKQAVVWLQNWLENREVTCHIVSRIVKNKTTGVCFVGQYDVAAVVTNAGWAVAYAANTDVYIPYEEQARENLRGLWNGQFYKPWDWRKIKNRKVTVKVKQKSSGSSKGGLFGVF